MKYSKKYILKMVQKNKKGIDVKVDENGYVGNDKGVNALEHYKDLLKQVALEKIN